MSSVSFSHEFYKHWMHTPQPVQAALVQELTDIIAFLQTDVTFDNFDFSIDDIDTHLDELYQEQSAQTVSQPVITTQPQTKNALPEKERPLDANNIVTPSITTAIDSIDSNSDSVDNDSVNSDNVNNPNNNPKNTDNPPPSSTADTTELAQDASAHSRAEEAATVNSTLENHSLSSTHESLINELSRHIDDYLSEQMAQLSEDLKSWLRAEISQKLTENGQETDK